MIKRHLTVLLTTAVIAFPLFTMDAHAYVVETVPGFKVEERDKSYDYNSYEREQKILVVPQRRYEVRPFHFPRPPVIFRFSPMDNRRDNNHFYRYEQKPVIEIKIIRPSHHRRRHYR